MGAILFQHARIFRTSLFNNHVSRSLTVTLGTCDLSRGFPRVQNKATTFINSANDRHDLITTPRSSNIPNPKRMPLLASPIKHHLDSEDERLQFPWFQRSYRAGSFVFHETATFVSRFVTKAIKLLNQNQEKIRYPTQPRNSPTPSSTANPTNHMRALNWRTQSPAGQPKVAGSGLRNASSQAVLTPVRTFASVKERSASPLQQRRPCGLHNGRTHCPTQSSR